jgi:hypothetical protein
MRLYRILIHNLPTGVFPAEKVNAQNPGISLIDKYVVVHEGKEGGESAYQFLIDRFPAKIIPRKERA